jgi:hypothetical protein
MEVQCSGGLREGGGEREEGGPGGGEREEGRGRREERRGRRDEGRGRRGRRGRGSGEGALELWWPSVAPASPLVRVPRVGSPPLCEPRRSIN